MHFDRRFFVAGAALIAAAACSEPSATPTGLAASRTAPAFDYSGSGAYGTQSSSFTVTSKGGSFSLGGVFTVNFPNNSICDPDLSSYGPGEWDRSCVTLGDRAVNITATVLLTPNGAAVDFSPALRFAPEKVVTISTDIFASTILANKAYYQANPSALRPLAIYYSNRLGSAGIADYLSDPTLVTHIDLTTGRVWRRVKHFSGYSQTSGLACNPSPDDPDCIEIQGDGP